MKFENVNEISILGAPKIAKDFGLRDIVVPAGEEFKITVPFSGGSPPPDATWTVVRLIQCPLN